MAFSPETYALCRKASGAAAEIADGIYPGADLTERFAAEIAGYSDPWAWIQARVQAGNFDGIHVGDFIPFETTEATPQTFHAQIAGIDTYKGYGDEDHVVGHHIDFICEELWGSRRRFNYANYNNGLIPIETITGDGATTDFVLTKEMDDVASVKQDGAALTGWTYDPATFTLTFAEAPTAGTITVTGTGTEYPWLASDLYLFLNSRAGQTPNGTVLNPAVVRKDYTSGGVYYYLPAALQAVIAEKRAYIPKRYSSSGLLTDDNGSEWADIGKLWLPSEWEVYGGTVCGSYNRFSAMGSCVQYPLFESVMNRLRMWGGARSAWWLLSAMGGSTAQWCCVSSFGMAYYSNATLSTRGAPICFRVM